ncbi:fetuin-B-like [Polyodon spathula]|uniref:fetuin-B-like n=1 Tax=Polyodon spathula TaxID=7913 RepID=UPI001B7E5DB4|nr:fetuin-B-like [Polyodon spathula]
MKLVCLLLLCTQLLSVWATDNPSNPMETGSCEKHGRIADLALRQINADRKEGYIFSLYRLSNVNLMQQRSQGTVYYLTVDVLETECHVLSKKKWRSCKERPEHESVYGHCQAIIYVNSIQRINNLYSYNCTIRPVPAEKIVNRCPDCPILHTVDSGVITMADLLLNKYNNENGNANYFGLLNVTRASVQWNFGTSYSMQFTIQETVCTKDMADVKLSQCEFMSCKFAHKGHCKGSYRNGPEVHMDISCEVFEPKASNSEEQPRLLGGEPDLKDQQNHLHAHEQHHNGDGSCQPQRAGPLGTVQLLPAIDQSSLASLLDLPVVSEPVRPVVLPRKAAGGKKDSDAEAESDVVIFPFPETISEECPGQPKKQVDFIQSLFIEDPDLRHPVDILG